MLGGQMLGWVIIKLLLQQREIKPQPQCQCQARLSGSRLFFFVVNPCNEVHRGFSKTLIK